MKSAGPAVNVLYGTVTGNAEEIARRVHGELESTTFKQGLLRCLSDYADIPAFVEPQARTSCYNVIVVSTTGEGDPPETIRPFMRLLRKKDPALLKGLNFTVLALGDTNYENFCNTGKRIDRGLAKLGANCFHKRGDADDGVGLELVVEPWLESLWLSLEKSPPSHALNDDATSNSEKTSDAAAEAEELSVQASPTADGPELVLEEQQVADIVQSVTIEELGFEESKLPKLFPPKVVATVTTRPDAAPAALSVNPSFDPEIVRCATISDAKRLTAPDSDSVVWHMEVSCSSENAIEKTYRPGDAFGVIVENEESEVNRFLSLIQTDGETYYELKKDKGKLITAGSAYQFAKQRIDLRAIPKKGLLRAMSNHCEDIEDRKRLLFLCCRDGRRMYTEEVTRKGMSIVQLLEQKAPSCRAPLSLFLDQLPGVAPRWYSATSSPELDGHAVLQFAFSVVEKGLATNALSRLCQKFVDGESPDTPILLIPRDSDSTSYFRPPKCLDKGYVMIGPGTGVAPFRGYLRERRAQLKTHSTEEKCGKTMLFFGCRHAEKDFLYKADLYELEECGALTSLDTAFSRDGPQKVYVQHRLAARGPEVAEIVRDGGSIFVCGDGGAMAQDVHVALGKVLAEHCCDGNEEEGKSLVRTLAEENRYVRDIWFHGEL